MSSESGRPTDPRFQKAAALIKAKRYDEARTLLKQIGTPQAKEWYQKLAAKERREAAEGVVPPTVKPVRAKIGMKRVFVWVWGILALLSCGWMVYGLMATQTMVNTLSSEPVPTSEYIASMDPTMQALSTTMNQAATGLGVGLGASVGIAFFLCTGIPVFLLSLLFYLVTSGRIRKEQQHAEILNATRGL